jgi:hypothetical protein
MSERQFLARKLLCSCPICHKRIFGETLGLPTLDTSRIKRYPFPYVYVHTHSADSMPPVMHAITIYLDADMAVRSIEDSLNFKIDTGSETNKEKIETPVVPPNPTIL